MRRILTILGLILCFSNAFGQIFKTNSIGVVKLNKIEKDSLVLEIIFPINCIAGLPKEILKKPYITLKDSDKAFNKFKLSKPLIIANEKGQIYSFEKEKKYKMKLWCENDGGVAIVPDFELKIHKKDFNADFSTNDTIKNIICFAIINLDKKKLQPTKIPAGTNALKMVDFDKNGNIDAYIGGEPDEAMGGLCLFLAIGDNGNAEIDCCGP
jgi:hypothetical protein